MFPHERSLVAKLADKPFVLIGVNSDEDREATRARIAKEGLPWRSFWNGGTEGAIAADWNVRTWGGTYIIDPNGIIRYKGFGNCTTEIDAVLAELLGVELPFDPTEKR
jgi:hypothetical protein